MTNTYTDEQIEALLENITQGEWNGQNGWDVMSGDITVAAPVLKSDLDFIAAAPTIIRQLLLENKDKKRYIVVLQSLHSDYDDVYNTLKAELDVLAEDYDKSYDNGLYLQAKLTIAREGLEEIKDKADYLDDCADPVDYLDEVFVIAQTTLDKIKGDTTDE